MRRYKIDSDRGTQPQAVECDRAGYPHRDADGEVQYDNTHFDTEAEAWDGLLANRRADTQLSASGYRQAEAELERARNALARAASLRDEAERHHEAWRDAQPTGRTAEEKARGVRLDDGLRRMPGFNDSEGDEAL